MDAQRNIGMSARTLVLDLLDTGDPVSFSVRELVRAGAAFGIEPTGIRTALTRLKAEGRVRPLERGRYTIGAGGEPLKARILGWRAVPGRRRDWAGDWLLAVAGPRERSDRTRWRRTVRALELEGFVEAETNVWVRPDNLDGGAEGMRASLAGLEAAPSLLLLQARALDVDREARYRGLWQGDVLREAHRRHAALLDQSAAAIDTVELPAAAAETLLLGRQAIRAIMRDPLLPESLCPGDALERLIAAMDHYDRVGKNVWRAYLAG